MAPWRYQRGTGKSFLKLYKILVAKPKACVKLQLFWGEQQAVVAIAATVCIFLGVESQNTNGRTRLME